MRDRLPPQYQSLPDDVLLKGLVDQLVDQQLLATALSASPETDPLAVKLAVENERRTVLAGLAVSVLPESALKANMRILGAREGFPELEPAEIGLLRAEHAKSPIHEALARHIVTSLGNLAADQALSLAAE